MKKLVHEIKSLRFYILIAIGFLLLSYSVYLFFDESVIIRIGAEDNLFEWLTAICFFVTSILFLILFIKNRKSIILLFVIIFFVGGGEEISWGQRIFNFKTPQYMEKINVQKEFSLHNIELLNARNFDKAPKKGISKLLTINFLYKLFWVFYCILFPLLYGSVLFIKKISDKINLPVPPISIGIFFLINWLLFRIISSYLLSDFRSPQYENTIYEISECGSSFLFFLLSFYFLTKTDFFVKDHNKALK